MKMGVLLSVVALLLSQVSQAAVRSLRCTSGKPYEVFSAVLDDSHYDARSGYFQVRDGVVADNYAKARLICTGYSFESLGCVGFWFGNSEEVVKVSLIQKDGGWAAVHKTIEGGAVPNTSPWPCTVQE